MEHPDGLDITRRGFLKAGAAAAAVTSAPQAAGAARDTASAAPPMSKVSFTVNGKRQTLELDTRTTLLDALREHLHLTGTEKGLRPGPVRRLYRAG